LIEHSSNLKVVEVVEVVEEDQEDPQLHYHLHQMPWFQCLQQQI
jgi:hypothetical protein